MRYVVLVAMGAFSVVLSGSFVSGLNIAGIHVDIVLLIVVALALADKGYMPIIFAACTGLFMDIMYSTVLGVYGISYTIVAALVVLLLRKAVRFNILTLFLAGAGGYLLKEIIIGALVYILGGRFNMMSMMLRYILPETLLNGLLLLATYWLISHLLALGFMRPRRVRGIDEI